MIAAAAVVVVVVLVLLRAVPHGDRDAQDSGRAPPGDVLFEKVALVGRERGEVSAVLDELPRGQRISPLHGVVERRPVQVVALVEVRAVLNQKLEDADVTAVCGQVKRRAPAGETFRHAHLEVRVHAGLESDLDELPGAAEGAGVQGRPLVDQGGEHLLDEGAVSPHELFGPLY